MQNLFEVGGRRLYAEVHGRGGPAVVVEVGSTMPGSADAGWWPIRDALAGETAVFFYDRAGLGKSDPARLPRTIDDFAADLRAVLQAAGVPPPYILVGGSFGGLIVTHYASLYPEEVQGVVLVDAPHPETNARVLAMLPPQQQGEPQSLADFRQLTWQEQHAPLETGEAEGLDYPECAEQYRARWNLRDIPLTVLTAGLDEWDEGFPEDAEGKYRDVARAYKALWLDMQKEYAALSTRSRHIVVEDSDHIIHDRRPDVVIKAIRSCMRVSSFPS